MVRAAHHALVRTFGRRAPLPFAQARCALHYGSKLVPTSSVPGAGWLLATLLVRALEAPCTIALRSGALRASLRQQADAHVLGARRCVVVRHVASQDVWGAVRHCPSLRRVARFTAAASWCPRPRFPVLCGCSPRCWSGRLGRRAPLPFAQARCALHCGSKLVPTSAFPGAVWLLATLLVRAFGAPCAIALRSGALRASLRQRAGAHVHWPGGSGCSLPTVSVQGCEAPRVGEGCRGRGASGVWLLLGAVQLPVRPKRRLRPRARPCVLG